MRENLAVYSFFLSETRREEEFGFAVSSQLSALRVRIDRDQELVRAGAT